MCPLNAMEILPLTKVHNMPENAGYIYVFLTHTEIFEQFYGLLAFIWLRQYLLQHIHGNFQAIASALFMM